MGEGRVVEELFKLVWGIARIGRRSFLVVEEECSSAYNTRLVFCICMFDKKGKSAYTTKLVFCICMLDEEGESGRREVNLQVEKMVDNLRVLITLEGGSWAS